jgi:hypothetical protein
MHLLSPHSPTTHESPDHLTRHLNVASATTRMRNPHSLPFIVVDSAMESLRPSPWQSSPLWDEMAASADRSVEPSPNPQSEGSYEQRSGDGAPLVFGHFAMPEDSCWTKAGAASGRLAAAWEAEAAPSWPYGGADSPRQGARSPGLRNLHKSTLTLVQSTPAREARA